MNILVIGVLPSLVRMTIVCETRTILRLGPEPYSFPPHTCTSDSIFKRFDCSAIALQYPAHNIKALFSFPRALPSSIVTSYLVRNFMLQVQCPPAEWDKPGLLGFGLCQIPNHILVPIFCEPVFDGIHSHLGWCETCCLVLIWSAVALIHILYTCKPLSVSLTLLILQMGNDMKSPSPGPSLCKEYDLRNIKFHVLFDSNLSRFLSGSTPHTSCLNETSPLIFSH